MTALLSFELEVAAILDNSNSASSAIDWDLVFVFRKTISIDRKVTVAPNTRL